MHYQLTRLANGLRVITETMPGLRSVALGFWVDTGTRDEQSNEAGTSHFLEHLLFKGSERLSSREISERFDAIGAESNAFTTKDQTCFWARLVDTDLPEGMEILSEMLMRPAFRSNEIDSERQVVIEEINMNDDDPSDVAFEEFSKAVFAGHPLENPVLGTRESIRGMSRDDIAGYWKRRYGAGSTVLALAGSIEHERAVELAEEHFGTWAGETIDHEEKSLELTPKVRLTNRDTEQANLVWGGLGLKRSDERRFAFELLNHVLGGGMSSRLFMSIREERGLAYAVQSFRMWFSDIGCWGIYAGTTPDQTRTVLELMRMEVDKVIGEGITAEELERAKGNMRGGIALSMEDPNSRMNRLGRDESSGLPHLSVGERIARLEAVTLSDVRMVAGEVMTGRRVLGAVGPFSEGELEEFVA